MSKLGLVITSTREGYHTIKTVNDDAQSWSKAVEDERVLLNNFKQAEGERRCVTFISFLEDGCLLTVMRLHESSRDGDNVTAWVFIPRILKLSKSDFQSIWGRVKNSLGCDNVNEMYGTLGDTFTKEYEDCKHPLGYKPSASDGHLAKYVVKSDFNAFDFLERRYQPKYPTYKYVFILGEKDSLELKPEAKFDTIAENPRQMCLLLAPDENLKSKLGKGTRVYLRDGAEFVGQIQACKGEKAPLILKREGFKDQEITVTFEKEVQDLTKDDFKNISWIKTIVKSQFRVVNKKSGLQISAFSVTINGKSLGLSGCDLKEGDLQNALVLVTAEGYKKWEGTRDLSKALFDSIELEPEVVKKEYGVLLSDERTTAKVTWQEEANRLGEPLSLPGYTIKGKTFVRNDALKKNNKSDAHKGSRSKTNWRDFLIGAASALLLITLLAVAGYFVFFKDGPYQLIKVDRDTPQTIEMSEEAKQEQPQLNTGDNKSEVASLCARLDSIIRPNWRFEKTALDSISELKGLYDDLNKFKFENLRKKWKTQLAGSTIFENIISGIGDLQEDPTNGQFTDKEVIPIKDYEDKIKELKSKAKGSGAQKGKGNTEHNASSSEASQGNI